MLLAVLASAGVHAADDGPGEPSKPQPGGPPQSVVASQSDPQTGVVPPIEPVPAPELAPGDDAAPPSPPRFEGAIGLVLQTAPRFAGASGHSIDATPSIYLRYGRWTFSTSGLFVTRRTDDVFQGLGRDLHRGQTVRTNFSLRLQRGTRSARSSELPEAPSTRSTLRGLLTTTWMPQGLARADGWKVTAALGTDLLRRGGGQTLDLGVGREHPFPDGLRWSYGLTLSAASGTYLRQRFGVTEEEALRTGYPAYRPDAGLREVSLGMGWRRTLDPHWQVLWGGSVNRLLGPAADSPLVQRRGGWSARVGVARSF